MRYPLLTVILLFVANATAAQGVEFSDAELAACVSAAMQKQGVTAAEELTTLVCNAAGIRDSSGITRLSQLKTLSLFGNQLSSIDLHGLDDLESLNLANNALRKIDVSQNTLLHTLYIFGNGLGTLDLRANVALTKLKAEKNRLLDVSFGPSPTLEKVYLFNNEMVDIKIDSLTGLRFIDVRANPMPDEVYDYLDAFSGVKASHDGNTEDWE